MKPYTHRCTIQTGDLAGNDFAADVSATDVEYKMACENCGEPLATVEQIVAHIYEELVTE